MCRSESSGSDCSSPRGPKGGGTLKTCAVCLEDYRSAHAYFSYLLSTQTSLRICFCATACIEHECEELWLLFIQDLKA